MNPAILSLLLKLVTDAPHLVTEAAQTYADVAHGEGGFAKVQKAAGDLAQLLGVVAAPVSQQQPQ
jgi:hypothetical protein